MGDQPIANTCPSCGHCSSCGRGATPVYPAPYMPTYPPYYADWTYRPWAPTVRWTVTSGNTNTGGTQ